MIEKGNKYLKPICTDEEFFIEACDGSANLVDSTDLFTFIGWPDNRISIPKGIATGKVMVEVYEMLKKVQFVYMLNSLKRNKKDLLFTPHQIERFIVDNLEWLEKDNCDTYLFFETNDEVLGAHALCGNNRTDLYFSKLNEQPLWPHGFIPRLVVPWMD